MTAALVALLFLASLVGKLLVPNATFAVLTSVWGMNGPLATTAFALLVGVEAAVVVGVLLPATRRLFLAVTVGLMVAFSASIAYQILTRSTLPCGCGITASGGSKHYYLGLLKNGAIVVLCVLQLSSKPTRRFTT